MIVIDTKNLILKTALAMFAQKGCGFVSIRDIAYAVGIKESSIYYHFKNKQDIINHLHRDVEVRMAQMKEQFMQRFTAIVHVSETEFIAVALHFRHSFFESEPFAQFIDMLSIERYSNQQADALYQKLLFEVPLEHQQLVFQLMHEKKIFRSADAALLAKEYHYMVYCAHLNRVSDQDLSRLIQGIYRREINQ